MAIIAFLSFATGIAASTITLVAQWMVSRSARRHLVQNAQMPPVTVLKPLKGVDDGLRDNLECFARQDYPEYQLILGIADPDDPALEVAKSFQADHPEHDIKISVGRYPNGVNPKVANLSRMVEHAKYDTWLVSDANVRPGPDYLKSISTELADPRVGLVHNVLLGVAPSTRAAQLEALHLNSWVATAIGGAEILASHPCVIGKSMLLRRQALEDAGGWDAVRNVLAEDYVLGQRIHRTHRVALSFYRLPVYLGRRELSDFLNRYIRWGQMRRWISPWVFFIEPLLNPVPIHLFSTLLAWFGGWHEMALCNATLAGLKVWSDAHLWRHLTGRPMGLNELWLIPVKDSLVAYMWIMALLRRTVSWRGQEFWISSGSLLTPKVGLEGLPTS